MEVLIENFDPGASFFVPCFDTERAKHQIRSRMNSVGITKLWFEVRIEEEKYGLRVWRRA